jgi:hypothetical protein
MHHKAIPRPEDGRDNERVQRAVLALVLSEHPTQLTLREVEREVDAPVEDAVVALVAAGLFSRQESLVLATPAAVSFDRLA